jgi:predicted DNA-binding transcriptional regulator AlpA
MSAAPDIAPVSSLPLEQTLWTRADCGRFLQYTSSTMRKRVEKLPGYPKPLRPIGHARWIAAEIIAWATQR